MLTMLKNAAFLAVTIVAFPFPLDASDFTKKTFGFGISLNDAPQKVMFDVVYYDGNAGQSLFLVTSPQVPGIAASSDSLSHALTEFTALAKADSAHSKIDLERLNDRITIEATISEVSRDEITFKEGQVSHWFKLKGFKQQWIMVPDAFVGAQDIQVGHRVSMTLISSWEYADSLMPISFRNLSRRGDHHGDGE